MAARVGVIGGTGLYEWPRSERIDIETAWGHVPVWHAELEGRQVFFVARHGARHERAAHRVDYRAIVRALASAGCTYVLAVNNSGALVKDLAPGSFVVPDDFIDLTKRRVDTFHDEGAVHVHATPAYCPTASRVLVDAARARPGVYVAVEGPRFETVAEARRMAAMGGHVVGMTGYPEVVLAREAGLHYACLAYVANHAPGVAREVSARTIRDRFAKDLPRIRRALRAVVGKLPDEPPCSCDRGLAAARLA